MFYLLYICDLHNKREENKLPYWRVIKCISHITGYSFVSGRLLLVFYTIVKLFDLQPWTSSSMWVMNTQLLASSSKYIRTEV